MNKKIIISIWTFIVLVSCIPMELNTLQTPITETPTVVVITPFIDSKETATLIVTESATPFPDEGSLKTITDDGKWEISVSLGHNSTIQVKSVDGEFNWVLDETTLPDILFGQLWNYKTSNDGKSLYFGLGAYQYEAIVLNRWPPNYGLYKLDLTDGNVETILKPHKNSFGHAGYGYFALSPDESQIIYSWWNEPQIAVRNLATLEEEIIPLSDNYKIAGPFAWSPNGTSIIFTMWSNVWDYPTDYQLTRLDIVDKSMHLLYSDNEKNSFFVPTDWVKDKIVYLVDRRVGQWQINPFTGQLQERTPPP